MIDTAAGSGRRAELSAALAAVRDRVEASCAAHGRDPEQVTLVVVTKLFPVTDLVLLADLGVADIGESREREASAKLAELAVLNPAARAKLRVHLVGQLQTNKAAAAARYADVVHSVDRQRLVRALSAAAETAGREVDVLVQVDLADGTDPGRGGARRAEAPAVADLVAAAPGLRLRGVMAVAPLVGALAGDPDSAFAALATTARGIQASHPDATWISAGMSGDLEPALAHGATHLRVGSAILGSRPRLG